MDVLCLVIWILNLIITVADTAKGEPINPVVAILAMLVCVVLYLEKILG